MRKFISQLLAVLLLAGVTVTAEAAKKGPPPKDPGTTGKITALDLSAKTLTLDSKVIAVDSTTIVQRDGLASTLESLKVGEQANITTVNLADKATAVTIKVGTAPTVAAPPAKKKK